MKKRYLKDGDRVFAECYLVWDEKKKGFLFESMEEGWYDGNDIEWDNEKPYTEVESGRKRKNRNSKGN